jgi:8-oxo-dGTP diphosphatase
MKPALHIAPKAVIVNTEDQVLILREAPAVKHSGNTKSGRYQLPGGKLEPGETFEECLQREVFEETGLYIEPGEPLLVGEWWPVVRGTQQQIIGVFVAAKPTSTAVRLSSEHDACLWIDPAKRTEYDIVPPGCNAIDAYVAKRLNRHRV